MDRRKFVKTTAVATAATAIAPGFLSGCSGRRPLMKRMFAKTGFQVTTMGLGGQASIQWTPDDVDPVQIIRKAFVKGINYFDTSNLYGPSQLNFGKAFRTLHLIPEEPGYDETLRKSIFLTTKTHLRIAKGDQTMPGVNNWTNGERGSRTIDDLRRSLSQMFGDGSGAYPARAYVDMVLIHNLNTREEVDALYEGLDHTDPSLERIGALAALRDYRDGTNLTGLNHKKEKLVRYIGFSGHYDPSVMMYMMQRDRQGLLDAMLVSINANDKLMFNMQHNVIPLAKAKNMGVIGMKVFADGAMYTKPAQWSSQKEHVVRTVGDSNLPSKPLIQYALTTPGVDLLIIGIGQVSESYEACQLSNNLDAAQIAPDGLNESERAAIEEMAKRAKEGRTNYFQLPAIPLTAPGEVVVKESQQDNARRIELGWSTAYAADAPIKSYEIFRDGTKVREIPFSPQLTTEHITYTELPGDQSAHQYVVRVVDAKGRRADSAPATSMSGCG